MQSKRSSSPGLVATIITGLRVVLFEAKWAVLNSLRGLELRSLRARLTEEYAALGKSLEPDYRGLAAGATAPPVSLETELALKQIAFLSEEIAYLTREREQERADYVARFKTRHGLSDPTPS